MIPRQKEGVNQGLEVCKIGSLETQLEGPCNFYPKPSKMVAKAPALTPRFQVRKGSKISISKSNTIQMLWLILKQIEIVQGMNFYRQILQQKVP